MQKTSRFETPLTASLRNPLLVYGLIGLAIIGYFMPWLIGGGVSLTFGAYDLGEWVSLRLPARPMDTVLLLRVIPVLLTVLIGLFGSNTRRWSVSWWLSLAVILLIAIALLPPFEFFLGSTQRGDVNYSQQFRLAGAALLFGVIAFSGIFQRLQPVIVLMAVVAVLGVTVASVLQVWGIVDELGLMPQLGLGPVFLIGSLLVLSVITIGSALRSST
jgi:hypothetical protein